MKGHGSVGLRGSMGIMSWKRLLQWCVGKKMDKLCMDEPGVIQFVVVDSTECCGQVDFKLREVKKRWEPLTLLSSFKNITWGSTISKPNIQRYVAWQRNLQNAIKGVMKPNLFPPTFNQSVVLETKKWTCVLRLNFPMDHCSHDYVLYHFRA